jgi:serine/threonine protein kinase/tetratricopeptide (TPR) repeat protein
MNDSQNRDVEVFTEALRLPRAERAVFLDGACGNDAKLRRQVEALLEANASVGDFLEHLPQVSAQSRTAVSAGEKAGDRIGYYKLLQQIGEGGCGVVFMAEQEEPVRRRVALKIIKPGMDSKSVVARFEAERQALALMEHPNIARVIDAGATASGRPYFVMELVRGVKITDYCDLHSLPTADRLNLFIQVCGAVQHAHQKGIIHRDLKPSNILITTSEGKPTPKVIDFGIAKATTGQRLTDKTLFTAFEMLIGTPAYMSPEQADLTTLDVDTRSDIYSMGVLLYELLTGTTPFDTQELLKAGLDEVRRVIRTRDPVRPSTRLSTMAVPDLTSISQRRHAEPPVLIREVRGDLDWIVMKAMEKDRTRRYETANGLALDVQRHLDNEAILARPPSRLYKFQKAVARNKILFGAVVAIAALLVIGLVLVTASLGRERQARREVTASLGRERQAHLEANSDKQKAETEAARSTQTTRFLKDMLQGVGPSAARGRDTVMLREILDKTAARIGSDMGNQPGVEAEMRGLIGRLYFEIGNFEEAEKMDRAAIAIRRTGPGADDRELAQTLSDLGRVLRRREAIQEAEPVCKEALSIRQRLYGHEHLDVAASLNDLAGVYFLQGKYTNSERLVREGLDIRRKLQSNQSLEQADSLFALASTLAALNERPESESASREALAIRRKLLGNEDVLTASSLIGLITILWRSGKLDEAEAASREALSIRRKVLGDEHLDTAMALDYLGHSLHLEHKLTESEAASREAISIYEKKPGPLIPAYFFPRNELIKTLEEQRKWAEIEVACREVLRQRERPGMRETAVVDNVGWLFNALRKQGKFSEADQLLAEILSPDFVKKPSSAFLRFRAAICGQRGQWQQAANDAALAHEMDPVNPDSCHLLAPLLVITHNRTGYEQLCRQIQTTFTNVTDPYVADRMAKDCLLVPSTKVDMELVGKWADTAVTAGSNSPAIPYFQTCKALDCYRRHQFADAVAWGQKATDRTVARAQALPVLAMSYWRLGQKEDARAALAAGNTLAPANPSEADKNDPKWEWFDWIFARILLDEAQALMESNPGKGE